VAEPRGSQTSACTRQHQSSGPLWRFLSVLIQNSHARQAWRIRGQWRRSQRNTTSWTSSGDSVPILMCFGDAVGPPPTPNPVVICPVTPNIVDVARGIDERWLLACMVPCGLQFRPLPFPVRVSFVPGNCLARPTSRPFEPSKRPPKPTPYC